MLIKLLLVVVVLSLSVLCFAEPAGNKSKLLIDPNQQKQLSTDTNQQKQSPQSGSSAKKGDSQSTQESSSDTKPSMIDYCRKHTC